MFQYYSLNLSDPLRGQGQKPGGPKLKGWQPRVIPHLRSRGAAKRRYPASKVGAVAGRSNTMSKELWLCGRRRA